MDLITSFHLIVGLVLLAVGADFLVAGAVSLARRLRIPLLIIGLTVVAWGTSAPELVVSVEASLTGHPGVSIGNLVGSNIANFLLIGGICATIMALPMTRQAFLRDGGSLLLATALFLVFFVSGVTTVWKGLIMLGLVLGYSAWLTRSAFKTGDIPDELEADLLPWFGSIWRVVVGAAFLMLGGKFLIEGAVDFAVFLGVDEAVVGLTVVAVGTSLPELAASMAAVRRKQPDIVIGNLIGSNIYNILAIMGLVSLLAPGTPMPAELIVRDMWIMAAATALVLGLIWYLRVLPRWSGPLLLAGYTGFLIVQVAAI